MIYQGGWPYRWDKRQLPGRRGELAAVGEPFARFVLEDQFGERVHLWDFYGDDDRPVILVVCAMWERLGPGNACDLLPRLVRGGDPWSEYYAEFESVFEAIRAGGVHLVTVVGENADGFPPMSEDIEAQAAPQVDVPGPVLLDPDHRVVEYVQLAFWPSTFLLDPELTVVDTGPWGDTPGALAGAQEILGAR